MSLFIVAITRAPQNARDRQKQFGEVSVEVKRTWFSEEEPPRKGGYCTATIKQNGRLTWSHQLYYGRIHEITGADVNGDGRPDVVFEEFSAGAHCCWTYWVVTPGLQTPQIAEIENNREVDFEKQPDGTILISAQDGSFDNLFTSHAGSYFPFVTLRLKGRIFSDVSAQDLVPYDKEIAEARGSLTPDQVAKFRGVKEMGDDDEETIEQVLKIVTSYLYSGREEQAWAALNELWPAFDIKRAKTEILKARQEGLIRLTRPSKK